MISDPRPRVTPLFSGGSPPRRLRDHGNGTELVLSDGIGRDRYEYPFSHRD
ncbi:hypothetical protein [Azospirillum doebereinerae]